LRFLGGATGLAIGLALSAMPAHAAEAPEPGLWRITTRTESGAGEKPARERTHCLTPEEARTFVANAPFEMTSKGVTCRSLDSEVTDNGQVLRLKCSGNGGAFDASARYVLHDSRRYTLMLHAFSPLAPTAMAATTTIEAQRLGDCTK
jgi:hypothetical protein